MKNAVLKQKKHSLFRFFLKNVPHNAKERGLSRSLNHAKEQTGAPVSPHICWHVIQATAPLHNERPASGIQKMLATRKAWEDKTSAFPTTVSQKRTSRLYSTRVTDTRSQQQYFKVLHPVAQPDCFVLAWQSHCTPLAGIMLFSVVKSFRCDISTAMLGHMKRACCATCN